ncbi:MAG: hypothetical protein A2Z47_10105 [Thermodesulfovibrio sp. RBG_19FT_COMBO_42_12]|nr:MAG: hypothetical protein A2Z47_10105 [Thermodesulfovibrio sp. RBG_19FT_COMBO_42_12]
MKKINNYPYFVAKIIIGYCLLCILLLLPSVSQAESQNPDGVTNNKPRVLFMIAEQNIGQKHYFFWWWGEREYMGETVDMSAAETSLKETFIEKGFDVVDISGTTGTFEISNAFKVADLSNDGAVQIAKKLNADIVVKGKALAKEGPRTHGSAVGSYIADVTAQAIRIDDGRVLASAKGHGTARNISEVTGGIEALSKAGNDAATRLIDQIYEKWPDINK